MIVYYCRNIPLTILVAKPKKRPERRDATNSPLPFEILPHPASRNTEHHTGNQHAKQHQQRNSGKSTSI